jgi:hypothetical protein
MIITKKVCLNFTNRFRNKYLSVYTKPLPISTPSIQNSTDDSEHSKYNFKYNFYNQKTTQFNTIQEGGYIDITKDELKKYFPEGLAGDTCKTFFFFFFFNDLYNLFIYALQTRL